MSYPIDKFKALSNIFLAITFTLLFLAPRSNSQFPPPISSDHNITTLRSPINANITIRFKSPPAGTCTTAFPTQKQYTGYICLPPFTLAPIQQNYSINTFFWFIEARTNSSTAPLTIYLNGGPGTSSMVGLFQEESGPCRVVEVGQDKLGTQPNDWGWDRSSNILYVDQPNQVGFSYDTPTNGSLNLITSVITEPSSDVPSGQPNYTFLNGTFSSNNGNTTANTTEVAARTVWHMLQGFLGAFPQYNPGTYSNSTKPGVVGVNLFAESYGGKYGPAFATFWEQQNLLRKNGSIPNNKTLEIRLSSLGIMQGCIDDLVQGRFYPIFANNNTYGIQALSLTNQQAAASSFLSVNGCQQLISTCRNAATAQDPQDDGNVATVNQICANAQNTCNDVSGTYYSSGRDIYDITQSMPDPFPSSLYLEYLNNADVQAAIGVPVNYTQTNTAVANAFLQTGDYERGDHIGEMAFLLSLGVRIALLYGDRDYICNWLGGEAVSFSIAAQAAGYSKFYSAGYADIVVNTTYVGGAVRQYGNLSFSRIYDAGHLIPAYQPETAFTVFTRIIMGNDISLGEAADLSTYTSNGTANATETNKAPNPLEPTCWVRNLENTCTGDQKVMLQQGEGVIINGVLYGEASDWNPPPSSMSVLAGYPGNYPTSTTTMGPMPTEKGSPPSTTSAVLTGVFTATSTPSPTSSKGAASSDKAVNAGRALVGFILAMGGAYMI